MQILKFLPKNSLSRFVGDIVSIEKPEALAAAARDWFVKRYHINMNEAELPLEAYPSIAKLFTRKLKKGVRPIGEGIVHPCDAALTCAEPVTSDTLFQAKGREYSLNELLKSSKFADELMGGVHLIYYLCPTDYHRVHSPVEGQVTRVTHIPGRLWPVNSWSVNRIDQLFAVNERVVFYIETPQGTVTLVMVGATNVGKISVSFDEEIVSNQGHVTSGDPDTPREKNYKAPIAIKKGDEIGVFNMGSTVIVIYPKGMVNSLPKLGPVKMGASI